MVHGHLITESYHKLHGHPQIQIGHDGILYCQAYIKTWIEVKLQYELYGHCHHITQPLNDIPFRRKFENL
jgi:hypothetical protein